MSNASDTGNASLVSIGYAVSIGMAQPGKESLFFVSSEATGPLPHTAQLAHVPMRKPLSPEKLLFLTIRLIMLPHAATLAIVTDNVENCVSFFQLTHRSR
jgi:hypothetical protein